MSKPPGKSRHEGKSGTFNPSKRPPRGISERTDRSSDGFRGRKDKSSEHFIPSGRTARDLPEKADRSGGDFQGRKERRTFLSFDRPKREPTFVPGDNRPVAQEQPKTVSATALKKGLERAKNEIVSIRKPQPLEIFHQNPIFPWSFRSRSGTICV